ncbi:hypothetical protein [Lysobacter gummosus]
MRPLRLRRRCARDQKEGPFQNAHPGTQHPHDATSLLPCLF